MAHKEVTFPQVYRKGDHRLIVKDEVQAAAARHAGLQLSDEEPNLPPQPSAGERFVQMEEKLKEAEEARKKAEEEAAKAQAEAEEARKKAATSKDSAKK